MTTQTAFLLPGYADTTPPSAPLPWDRSQEFKDLAEYIRARLRQARTEQKTHEETSHV